MHYIPTEQDLKHLGGNTIGGNQSTFYPKLWEWMIKTLNIHSVLDVGCGEGHALKEFKRQGCSVFGIDGAPRNASLANAVCHDLTKAPFILPKPVDLVWCCEVIGQIEEQYIKYIIPTLAQGRFVAFTHQLPNQLGYHMVNCQPPEYWCDKLNAVGYVLDEKLTKESKQYGHVYWSATGSIYRRA